MIWKSVAQTCLEYKMLKAFEAAQKAATVITMYGDDEIKEAFEETLRDFGWEGLIEV